jgi:hypothetical protein
LSSEEPDEKPEETSGTIEERETEDKRKHVGEGNFQGLGFYVSQSKYAGPSPRPFLRDKGPMP